VTSIRHLERITNELITSSLNKEKNNKVLGRLETDPRFAKLIANYDAKRSEQLKRKRKKEKLCKSE
uniref:Uncharacterized protein n=1 Tax=Panagrolaimus sp. JU765 TaxID=591449 RepID=A0AC34RR97_9BILA